METRTFDQTIKGIEMDISGRLYIKPGNANEINIEAQENIIENIKTSVSNNILWIEFDECVKDYSLIRIVATIPHTEYLSILGSGNIYSYDTVYIDKLEMVIKGSGDIHILVVPDTALTNSTYLESKIIGSGEIELIGFADNHDITITGSGDINAYELITDTTEILISGSGNCANGGCAPWR